MIGRRVAAGIKDGGMEPQERPHFRLQRIIDRGGTPTRPAPHSLAHLLPSCLFQRTTARQLAANTYSLWLPHGLAHSRISHPSRRYLVIYTCQFNDIARPWTIRKPTITITALRRRMPEEEEREVLYLNALLPSCSSNRRSAAVPLRSLNRSSSLPRCSRPPRNFWT